jgi:hypothetical protein
VEAAERYADGQAGLAELREAREAARAAGRGGLAGSTAAWAIAEAAVEAAADDIRGRHGGRNSSAAELAARSAAWAWLRAAPPGRGDDASRAAAAAEVAYLRDLFGNPLRRPPALAPAWLAWRGGLLVSLARRMYDAGDFADAPVLADMLQDAGCQDERVLGHCRGGGQIRGCFLLDAVLGKS